MAAMPRHLRLQYPDAIYHLMARGNGRQDIVRDDDDRQRLQDYLGRAVVRCSWRVYAFAIMSNHFHLVLKTPEPNLARGMQVFLSSYANASARRHRFAGHVFQGRYRTELVEDETYLWTVTRVRPPQPGPRPDRRTPGGLAVVELSGLCPSGPTVGVGGLRRAAGVVGRRLRRLGLGRGVPSVRDRRIGRGTGVALG